MRVRIHTEAQSFVDANSSLKCNHFFGQMGHVACSLRSAHRQLAAVKHIHAAQYTRDPKNDAIKLKRIKSNLFYLI